jgi:hypothetical protein
MSKKKEVAEKDFIKEALALAIPARDANKKTIDAEIKRAKDAKKSLLGIEKNSSIAIDNRIKELEVERRGLGYCKLSFEPLKWRNSKGLPRLVLYSIDRPDAAFSFDGNELEVPGPTEFGLISIDDSNAEGLATAATDKETNPEYFIYSDVFDKLEKEYDDSLDMDAVEYKTEFNGLLPTEVRELAKKEKKNFENLYILAEVQEWKRNAIARPRKGDPLLVGWDGASFWILAAFDLTPTEEYVKREFSS